MESNETYEGENRCYSSQGDHGPVELFLYIIHDDECRKGHNRFPDQGHDVVPMGIEIDEEQNGGQYQGNRIVYNRVKAREVVAGVKVPSDIGIRFKINKPGTFSMYPRFMYDDDERAQKFIAVLVTMKGGVTTATQIFEETKPAENMSTVGKEQSDKKYRVIFDVTEEMLSGIDEAATVYFWHAADNAENIGHMVSYFPPKWTSAKL